MSLYNKIIEEYPELINEDFVPSTGSIHLRDDSDGLGSYIAKWEYSKPLPDGLTVGKPSS